MKKVLLGLLLFNSIIQLQAQMVGDTIKVKTFHYGSNNRDTFIQFPSGNLTYEKIIMKYNMRCKNALVSNGSARDQGCGEWDYSCNTYIVDSAKIEKVLAKSPNYVVANYTGNSFNYTSTAPYDYYNYAQQLVVTDSVLSESQFGLALGTDTVDYLIKGNERSGKSQVLYRASELIAAGLTAGSIHGITLNVSNAGGKARFLRIKIKGVTANALNAQIPNLTGFTQVFNQDYEFVNGNNTIRFITPFAWDGIQNLVIEYSFTNTIASTPVVFNGLKDSMVVGLYANNNYALDLKNQGFVKLDASNLADINKEITISFWALGNSTMMPSNTTLLYGYTENANNRQLNIHLPYGNNSIYFDCGFVNGFDRIEKVSTASDQGGKWNHWTFTKNATSGSMKIYLNGSLWFSGTGKTKAISILNLLLGKDQNQGNNYKGQINELAIWKKEMPDSLILRWMNKPINASHPLYNQLLSYYPLNEGQGLSVTNNVTSMSSIGENIQWTYERGDKLTRTFSESTIRPSIQFLIGQYQLTIQNVIGIDSIKRNPAIVQKYSIVSNEGILPVKSDIVKLDTTYTNLYLATASQIINGDSAKLIGTIPVTSDGTLVISNLDYYNRFPFYNEIMSFVTPYGIGLDLGAAGKSWYFDVSDFAPLLKGAKRIVMTLGGQNQEQNDIEFWFIVGTPVRNVLAFDQLWQGTNRMGDASIASINNDVKFAPITVPLLANGKAFKMRSSITGHGADGEFDNNGGPIDHMLMVNGNTPFIWKIVKECASNPVFPQGGTWVYDRQGWCPGESSVLTENNLTPLVTPGSSVSIDYNTSAPFNTSGDYRYQVAHQLVTYGDPNFPLDARILDVMEPSDKILHGRKNASCSTPKILVQNSGSTVITKLEIAYWINAASQKLTYTWNGNLAFLDSAVIELPVTNLWTSNTLASGNNFYAEIKTVNSVADNNTNNNLFVSPFNKPEIIPANFIIELRTNNNPSDNSYTLYDENGGIVDAKTFTNANTTHSNTYGLTGCYRLVVEDLGHDGLSWWANTAQGTGFVRIKRTTGAVLKTLQPDFGSSIAYSFTTDWQLSTPELVFGQLINMYPNPATNKCILEGTELDNATVSVTDILGQTLVVANTQSNHKIELNTASLKAGMYFVVITSSGHKAVKPLIIQ